MKILIAPTHLHSSLRLEMMNKSQQNYLISWKFLSWEQFLNLPREGLMPQLKASPYLKELELTIFDKMIDYPYFIEQLIAMARLCDRYQINMNSLPEDTLTNRELKLILSTLYTRFFNNKKESVSTDRASDIVIYPYYRDLYEKNIADLLLSHGASLYEINKSQNIQRHLYKALNPQQEITSIAQFIIEHDDRVEDIQMICASTSYFPIVQHIFKRYQIPHYFVSPPSKKLLASKKWMALYELYLHRDLISFKKCLSLQVFKLSNIQDYQRYLDACVSDLDTCLHPFTYYQSLTSCNLFPHEMKDFIELEVSLASDQECIIHALDELFKVSGMKEAFEVIFDFIKITSSHEECVRIKDFVETNYKYLDEEHLDIFFYHLEKLSLTDQQMKHGLEISDMMHPLLPNKILFVVGLDQKNYPHFPSHGGYFDELYFQHLNYPSEQERFNHHIQQLEWLFDQSEIQYFSYAFADLAGKPKELSYHIESRFDEKAMVYPIIQNDINHKHTPYLSKEKASALFFKDNYHQSNVYKLEAYFGCPYRYFLQNGLKLNQETDPYPIRKFLGTINHDILQHASSKHQIQERLTSWLNELDMMYPNKKYHHQLLALQNTHQLLINLDYLKEFKETHSYQQASYEVGIHQEFKYDDITFAIKGYVDVLESYENFFRIIDFKSSTHKISITKILEGVKLQLATYMYCHYLNHKELIPTSIIYYSMSHSSYHKQSYDASYGQLKVLTDEGMVANYLKANKCSGLFFNDDEHQGEATFLSGLKRKKQIDVLELFKSLDEIYGLFVKSLQEGIIDIDPIEGVCSYCDFARICRFNQLARSPKPLVSIQEDEIDEME